MSIVVATFAPEAATKSTSDDLSAYVAGELRRLFSEGAAVLLAVLQFGVDEDAQAVALELLARGEDDAGERIYPVEHAWRLRLVEGAKPPPLDPQGRRLAPDLVGKVLRAKVGLLGSQRHRDHATPAAAQWDGNRRAAKAATGQPLHSMRDVTATPQSYTLREATLILRAWGVGCSARQYRRPDGWKPGDHIDQPGQDLWIVEEVPAAKPSASKTRAA